MKKYIEIFIGGKRYRFLIDEELDTTLRSSLKERYKFDDNNTLIIDDNDLIISYKIKQLILKSILTNINAYNLTPALQRKINTLKEYAENKNTVYNSDLTNLESVLGEASRIYNDVKTNLPNKELNSLNDEIKSNVDYSIDNSNEANNKEVAISNDDLIKEFKTIVEEAVLEDNLQDIVPVKDIIETIDRVVVCVSNEDFISKTADKNPYSVSNAINDKNEKIILPPNSNLENVTVEILKVYIKDETILNKVITNTKRKTTYQRRVNAAFESLRSSLKVKGTTARNLNYFGDQFFDVFESICKETGISFESMFRDYFNSYSQNRKYNSPMDRFIRLYTRFNGGNDNTRAMLEAMLVKKAIARNLISRKFNNYLKDEYRYLNVNGRGYINFNNVSFENINRIAGINSEEQTKSIKEENTINTEENIINTAYNSSESRENTLHTNIENKIENKVLNKEENNKEVSNQNKVEENYLNHDTNFDVNTNENINFHHHFQGKLKVVGARKSLSEINGKVKASGTRKFTSNISAKEKLIEETLEEQEENTLDEELENNSLSTSLDNSPDKVSDNVYNDTSNIEESPKTEENEKQENIAGEVSGLVKDEIKKKAKSAVLAFIKKNPWVWVSIGILVFFLLLIFIVMSNPGEEQELGYYDDFCNFNVSRVTINSCTTDEEIGNYDLQDYVINMTALYTNDDVSAEAKKALMILIKTNALALGNYNSEEKNVNIRLCDVYDGEVKEDTLFEELDTKDLTGLYSSISEYLYISESYTTSIDNLGSASSIEINNELINALEKEAQNGKNYEEILNTVFEVEEEENITVEETRPNLFLGDSRTAGLLNTGVINNGNTVYGIGYGYNWLVGSGSFNAGNTNSISGGEAGINAKITAGKSYNIIIWLGVNDLGSLNNYIEEFKRLAENEWKNHNLYIVSVGPVLDSKTYYAKNENINNFNNTMKNSIISANISNLRYIDLGLGEGDIASYDGEGLHYGSNDYQNIYNKMISGITNGTSTISSKRILYKLSDYCTYYTLTENNDFWWPIGSSNATEGNIYGGNPTATTITSGFGPRVVSGVRDVHGGVDISGGSACFNNVIIAAKSGTVTKVHDGCETRGGYGNNCGGSYGNHVMIDHGDGTMTVYAHMTKGSITVKEGSTVKQGEKIGIMGSSGSSTGCHLHFEVRLDGTKVNPLDYISAENPRSTSSLKPSVTGNNGDYKNMVCSSLLSSGFSKEATIGIMANLASESGYSPINLQNSYETKLGYTDSSYTLAVDNGSYKKFVSDAAGYGLAQWTSSGRKQGLYNYAKSKNASIGNFEMQFNYLLNELKTSYGSTYKYITGNHNAIDTGAYWCDHYEVPAGSEPCSYNGNCPSQYCVNRTNNAIASGNLTNYVNNGCK